MGIGKDFFLNGLDKFAVRSFSKQRSNSILDKSKAAVKDKQGKGKGCISVKVKGKD